MKLRTGFILFFAVFFLFYDNVQARMLVLESGLFNARPKTLRLDIVDIYAGYDKWTYEGDTTIYEYGRAIENMAIAYTVSSSLEVSASMQYMYWQQRLNGSETSHLAGFGQFNADLKYCLGKAFTFGLKYFHPYQNTEKDLGGGRDFKGYFVLESKSSYLSVGTILTGAYSVNNQLTGESTDYDPGDVITGGIGFRFGGDKFKLLFEIRSTNFALNKVNNTEMPGTDGNTIDLFPGMIFNLGKLEMKLGLGIGTGGTNLFGINGLNFNTENLRGPGTNPTKYQEVSYDFTPVIGISYSF